MLELNKKRNTDMELEIRKTIFSTGYNINRRAIVLIDKDIKKKEKWNYI